jgi:hypothetical protein
MSVRPGAFELQVLVHLPEGLFRISTIKLSGKGDLYFLNHQPLLAGKHSMHPGGARTAEIDLLHRRDYEAGPDVLGELQDARLLHAVVGGQRYGPPGIPVQAPKKDGRQRRSFILDWRSFDKRLWGIELWAYRREELVPTAANTPPYPSCTVVEAMNLPETDPHLLLKTWRAGDVDPYRIVQVTNEITGERFVRVPDSYAGTPFDRHAAETDLWLPRPLQKERYGANPSLWHPAHWPNIQDVIDAQVGQAAPGTTT